MKPSLAGQFAELNALIEGLKSQPPPSRVLVERYLNLLCEIDAPGAYLSALSLLGSSDAVTRELGTAVVTRLEKSNPKIATDCLRPAVEKLAVDVLIVTVKKVEFEAAIDALQARATKALRLSSGADVWIQEVDGFTYALASIGVDGNVESALKVGQLLQSLQPRGMFLVGMAAGVRGEVELGDVVVSEQVWATDFTILRKKKRNVPRPKTYGAHNFMWTNLSTFATRVPTWSGDVIKALERLSTNLERSTEFVIPSEFHTQVKSRPLKVKSGVIFAGSRLIEDDSLVGEREQNHGRLVAAEMEGAGFAASLKEIAFPYWLVVRGIADWGEEERVKDWQYVATFAAVSLVTSCISGGVFPLAEPRD